MDIDKLIDDCIDSLADDNANIGSECLVELAKAFAVTGMELESFLNLRTYIVQQALQRDQCPRLIETKLIESEKQLQRSRNGESSVIYFH